MSGAALVLLGHGSRDSEGAGEFLAVANAVRAALPGLPVEAGVLEFAGPVASSIEDAFARCAARGARRVLAVPVLLHFGGHATADMPAQVAAARRRYPSVEIRLAQPLGGHGSLLDLVAERCAAAEAALAGRNPSPREAEHHKRRAPSQGEKSLNGGPPALPLEEGWGEGANSSHTAHRRQANADTTALLVGRGSTSPRANADLYATSRLFQERGEYASVETCFVSLAPPCVPAGLRRCVALGARRVLVVPYFINTGLLVRRIARQIAAARLFYPAVDVAVAAHFGPDPHLVDALLDRAREAWPELVAEGTAGRSLAPSNSGGGWQGPWNASLVGGVAG